MDTEPTRFTLIVAFDFNLLGRRTLMEALKVTKNQANTQLHVVHVATPLEISKQSDDNHIGRQHQALVALREKVWRDVHRMIGDRLRLTPITVEICLGDPEGELLRVASALDADWIVVGDDEEKTMRSVLTTSVSQRLLQNAPCPVLRVRKNELKKIAAKSEKIDPPNERAVQHSTRPLPHYQPRTRGVRPSRAMSMAPATSGRKI